MRGTFFPPSSGLREIAVYSTACLPRRNGKFICVDFCGASACDLCASSHRSQVVFGRTVRCQRQTTSRNTQTTYHVPPPSPPRPSIFCLSIRTRLEKLRLPRGCVCGGWHLKTGLQININEKHINKGSGETGGKEGANCVYY